MVPEARKMTRISYDEMLELASAGAGVMHNRSIEFARSSACRSTCGAVSATRPGTMISGRAGIDRAVGVRRGDDQERGPGDGRRRARPPGAAHDHLLQGGGQEHRHGHDRAERGRRRRGRHLLHRAPRRAAGHAQGRRRGASRKLGAEGYSYDDDVAKISVVGLGMATQPGVAETMFRALAERGINILMISTSEIKISVVVAREFAQEALRTVHEAFDLEKQPRGRRRRGRPAAAARPATAPKPCWPA